MSRVYIVTDSTSDIPKPLREEYGIHLIPLQVLFGHEAFYDSVTIGPDEFYRKQSEASVLPTTSQPSPAEFLQTYQAILEKNPAAAIISIHLSSNLSGTYQSAVIAASMLDGAPDVTVIDSKSASFGIAFQVVTAAKAAKEGRTKDEILSRIERIREKTRIYFIVDTLEYLQKGGRIGKASALFGTLLNIKPILTLDPEGVVTPIDKVRGHKKAVARIVELLKGEFGPEVQVDACFAHAAAPELCDQLEQAVTGGLRIEKTFYASVGPVIGTHTGPGVIAVFVHPVVLQ
ncbi:DegV family protein [Paenibacillus sp. y28]|uniref:DegV family protein n=1 Tax=Paenibacillus sp. y28 TaxID=3129110 RepID=UPI003015FDF3